MTYNANGYVSRVGYKQQFAAAAAGASPPLDDVYGYYKMEEAVGPWVDEIGNFPNLTRTGSVVGATGLNNDAGSFPGAAFIGSADDAAWDFSATGMTFNMWINMDVGGHIQFHHTDQSDGYGLGEVGGGVSAWICWNTIGSGATSVNTPVITDSAWHMLTVGYNIPSQSAFLAFDGGTRTFGSGLEHGMGNFAGVFRLGNFPGGTYEGLIDEFAIWQRPITDEEVALLWNGGAGIFLS